MPVKKLLKSAVDSEEIMRASEANRILRQWPSIVGPLLNQKSRPDRFDHGTVWVAVSSSEWAQELRLKQQEILKRLRRLSPDPELFKQLRFGLRDFEPLTEEIESEEIETQPDLRSMEEIIAERRKKLGLIPPSEP